MASESLWGNLSLDKVPVTPVDILRDQAEKLGEATNNTVTAELGDRTLGETFIFDFDVRVPALNGYVLTLLSISHTIELYPVTIRSDYLSGYAKWFRRLTDPKMAGKVSLETSESVSVQDEEAFKAVIESILSSDEVHHIVYALVAQSKVGAR